MLPLEHGDNSRWGAWRMHEAKSIALVKDERICREILWPSVGRPAYVRVRASCVNMLAALAWTSPIIESSNGRVGNAISIVHKNKNYSHHTNPINHYG